MSTRTVKKLLLSLILIGGLASITTGGTYALFNSETESATSSIQSGTLLMTEKITSGPNNNATCTSQSGGSNSNASCSAIFTTGTLNYPGTLVTENLTLTNAGTVPGYDLGVSMPATASGGGCASADNGGVPLHGGGNACSSTGDLFYIQETYSNGSPLHCWYPAGGSTCSIAGGGTLNNFSTSYWYDPLPSPNGQSLLDLSWDGTSRYGFDGSNNRYFVIGLEEGNANNLQGETATFALLFHLQGS